MQYTCFAKSRFIKYLCEWHISNRNVTCVGEIQGKINVLTVQNNIHSNLGFSQNKLLMFYYSLGQMCPIILRWYN